MQYLSIYLSIYQAMSMPCQSCGDRHCQTCDVFLERRLFATQLEAKVLWASERCWLLLLIWAPEVYNFHLPCVSGEVVGGPNSGEGGNYLLRALRQADLQSHMPVTQEQVPLPATLGSKLPLQPILKVVRS